MTVHYINVQKGRPALSHRVDVIAEVCEIRGQNGRRELYQNDRLFVPGFLKVTKILTRWAACLSREFAGDSYIFPRRAGLVLRLCLRSCIKVERSGGQILRRKTLQ